ncbi:hypothetical protein SH528x_006950 [Novipirellula sp. SH528]|uniref:hypothetical protein n=1 Tax=Novipirellula sp. SH528 TaxID=3454466 RepID=UPI003FA09459
MMLSKPRCRFIVVMGMVLGAVSVVDAQSVIPTDVVRGIQTNSHKTREGGEVASWQIDPFMTEQQEADILAFLKEPCRFAWDDGLTLRQLTRDMSTRVATEIDVRALEEIGIKENLQLVSKRREQASFEFADVDPFAGPSQTELQSRDPAASSRTSVLGVAGNHTGAVPWWRSSMETSGLDSNGQGVQSLSVGATVTRLLEPFDLVLSIRLGSLTVTTQEGAEEKLCIRVYDVTPLVGRKGEPEMTSKQSGASAWRPSYVNRVEPLMQVIETSVDSSTWEALGGPSTMSLMTCRSRRWLVVAATSPTHWKIQAMLDRLNR